MQFVIMDVFFVLLLLDIFSHSFFKLNSIGRRNLL